MDIEGLQAPVPPCLSQATQGPASGLRAPGFVTQGLRTAFNSLVGWGRAQWKFLSRQCPFPPENRKELAQRPPRSNSVPITSSFVQRRTAPGPPTMSSRALRPTPGEKAGLQGRVRRQFPKSPSLAPGQLPPLCLAVRGLPGLPELELHRPKPWPQKEPWGQHQVAGNGSKTLKSCHIHSALAFCPWPPVVSE